MIRESAAKSRPGMLMLVLLPSLLLLSVWWLVHAARLGLCFAPSNPARYLRAPRRSPRWT